ncbi:Arsenical-resistance protein OS=Streptomyces microflavus OX=1919 GN=Smic_09380 PE=3 SV=1 [Streptomyces microflavus]
MYPVLAKVRYDKLDAVTGDRKLMASSAGHQLDHRPGRHVRPGWWIFLPDLPEYRTGLHSSFRPGPLHRAMVIIGNDLRLLADREAAAVLVALNSVFSRSSAFGLLGWLYLDLLPGWLGLGDGERLDISMWKIALNVAIFLGVLLAGFLTRRLGEKKMGRESYEAKFLPKIGPWALYGLLFTIVILFALQGKTITSQPLDVVRIALPLLVYFAIMFFGSFLIGNAIGLAYDRTTTLAFTAAGNNFELAIAVAIATFGVTSGQALSGVVGPLIEVPVLIALVYVALAWRKKFAPSRRPCTVTMPAPHRDLAPPTPTGAWKPH